MSKNNFPTPAKSARFSSIDFLRGFVIILMTVDHVRDMFFSIDIGSLIPEDKGIALFFTRFITHLCAPIFIFLAGLSVFLREQRYNLDRKELQLILIKRGLFLIVLEFTLVNFFFHYILEHTVYNIGCQVIFAIGAAMILLALVKWFSARAILLIGLVTTVGHNLLDGLDQQLNSIFWSFLHSPKVFPIIEGDLSFRIKYPILPWFGVICLGYACGYYWFKASVSEKKRNDSLLKLALACVVVATGLRYFNIYGDSHLFIPHENFTASLLSFLNVTKYPPSLIYLLLTLPFGLLILARVKNADNILVKIISKYGNAPLFYYLLHLALIPALNYLTILALGYEFKTDQLWIIWLASVLIVAGSYPLITWFLEFRKKYVTRFPILSYI